MNKLVKIDERQQQISPWAAYANEVQASAIDGDLLKYRKGKFYRGENDTDVPLGTRFVACMHTVWTGHCRWFNGKPVEYRGGYLIDFPPVLVREDLGHMDKAVWETDQQGNPKDPWSETDLIGLRDADGELLTFSTSSWGGRKAVVKLCREFDRRRKDHVGKYPVIEIGSKDRRSADYGLIPEPTFTIVGWEPWDEEEETMPDAPTAPTAPEASDTATKLDDEIPF